MLSRAGGLTYWACSVKKNEGCTVLGMLSKRVGLMHAQGVATREGLSLMPKVDHG